ncbi:MAG: flagellar basal body L-ring protein FlgH [Verrucomicrobiota bacterium]|jgi:flagellar L-ring protein precursor FlgH
MKKVSALLCKPVCLLALLLTFQAASLMADSLWKTDTSPSSIFADKKARRVGDIMTVIIQENNGATRNNTTATSKASSVDASIASFLYGPAASGLLTKGGAYPAMNFTGKNSYSGGGQINNQETITAQLAVRVIDVLPNGNLVIEGRKQTSFSGEKQDAILRGTVRFDDISSANSVYSYNIADASIQYISHGTITDAQNKGWFNKIWDKVNPF